MKPNGCLNDLERDWSSEIRMAEAWLRCSKGVQSVVELLCWGRSPKTKQIYNDFSQNKIICLTCIQNNDLGYFYSAGTRCSHI